jgi:hypothetical protein
MARIGDDEAIKLVRENLIRLTWKGDRICAMLGIEFHSDHIGFGETVAEALRDLAAKIEKQNITVWVRRPAKQYRDKGVLSRVPRMRSRHGVHRVRGNDGVCLRSVRSRRGCGG